MERKLQEVHPLLTLCGQIVENWQGNPIQKESLRVFFLVLQVTHYLDAGQVCCLSDKGRDCLCCGLIVACWCVHLHRCRCPAPARVQFNHPRVESTRMTEFILVALFSFE